MRVLNGSSTRPLVARVGRADGDVMSLAHQGTRHCRGETRDATVGPRLLVVRNDVQDTHGDQVLQGSAGFYEVLQGSFKVLQGSFGLPHGSFELLQESFELLQESLRPPNQNEPCRTQNEPCRTQ